MSEDSLGRWFSLFNSIGESPQIYLAIKDDDEAIRFEATYYDGKWQSNWVEYHYRAEYGTGGHEHKCSLFGEDSCDMDHGRIWDDQLPLFQDRCLTALVEHGSDAVFELLEEHWEKDHATNTDIEGGR